MAQIGYSVVLGTTEVHSWAGLPAYPEYQDRTGKVILKFKASRLKPTMKGTDGNTYKIVERHNVDRPTRYHNEGVESVSFDGTKTVADQNWAEGSTVAQAKVLRKADIDASMRARLAPSDPVVLEGLELANAFSQAFDNLPTGLLTLRQSIRDHADTLKAEIDLLTTLVAIDAYAEHDWPQ